MDKQGEYMGIICHECVIKRKAVLCMSILWFDIKLPITI